MRKHKIIPNHKKKPYSKPVITVIKLDPEQALLSACKTLGLYFRGTRGCLAAPRGFGYRCTRSVRSHIRATFGTNYANVVPS